MRKVLCAVFAVALLLSGCGGQQRDFTLEDAQTLLDAGLFDGEMVQIDTAILCRLYGVEQDTVDGAVSYQSLNTSVSADELTILLLTDESGAEAAEEACRQRLESQLEVCRDYCPGAVPRLEGAEVVRRGNTVLLAVGDPDRLPDAVSGLN